MSRLRELIDELCPDGVEYKALGSVCTFNRGKMVTKKDVIEGNVPVVSGGKVPAYYINESNRDAGCITIAGSGAGAGYVSFWTIPIWCCDSFTVDSDCSVLYSAYVFHFLKSHEGWIQSQKEGAGVPHVRGEHLNALRIPVPPIEVQREVVRILDSFQELDDALTAEIEAREKQYRFAQEKCFVKYFGNPVPNKPTADTVRLGDLYDVTSSQRIYQSEQSSCGVPFLRVSDLIAKMDGRPWESSLFITEDLYQSLIDADNVPKPGDILITARGTLGRYYFIKEDDRFYFQDGMITWMRATKDSPSHAFFSALFSNEMFLDRLIANCGQGTVKYLSIKGLSNTLVPKPDASKLEAFDSEMSQYELIAQLTLNLRSERDARRKQFEHYRDKLLSFPEKEA